MENNTSIKSVFINEKAFSLYQSKKITIQEALMLSIIASLDNEHGCFATNRYFADNLPIEVDRVKEIIRSLVKKGYIESKMVNNNTKRILRVVKDEKIQEQAPVKKEEETEKKPEEPKADKVVPINGHKKNYGKKQGLSKFCNIMTHDYNYAQLEALEQKHIAEQLSEINNHGLSDRAKELLAGIQAHEKPASGKL